MNVAVVKTGPGVTCPMATASSSWRSVNQCRRSTRSARRKASSTYPLPNNTAPILRKIKKSGPSAIDTGVATAACAATRPAVGMDNAFGAAATGASARCGVTSAPCPARIDVTFRATTAHTPARASTKSSFTPFAAATVAPMAMIASARVFNAVRPSPNNAWATTAMTTGLTPFRIATADGNAPNRTYAHPSAPTINVAGRMKHAPATSSPGQPARAKPT